MAKRILDIIIPHYKEPWEVCRPMFDMLVNQKGVDFNDFKVWLIHDGPVVDFGPGGYFEQSPLNIETISIEHKGVSACRNNGLDLSDSEWVNFSDCDDCFTSVFALMKIFYILKSEAAKNIDLFWSPFYTFDGKTLVKSEKYNKVFIHNKFYRRSFLIEHNIRFPEKIYMSEDSAFNTVVQMEIGQNKIASIDDKDTLYAWCRRPGSVTMDISKWIHNTEGHFDRNLYMLDQYANHGYKDLEPLIGRVITDVYSMLSRPGIQGDVKPLIERVRKFYQENKEKYLSVPEETIKAALKASDKDMGLSPEVLEDRLPLDEWIKFYLDPQNELLL